jgi:excisionase family DNA binding protein
LRRFAMMIKVVDAAKELGCSYNTLMKWIKAGKIHAIKIGRFFKIEDKELERTKSKGLRIGGEK